MPLVWLEKTTRNGRFMTICSPAVTGTWPPFFGVSPHFAEGDVAIATIISQ
jgi:hypothetical protein